MAKPMVTLTFAGDTQQLESAFDRVATGAKSMGDKVEESGKGFDAAAERTDDLDTKAMGFRDTITGVQDSVLGFGAILKGDFSADALLTAGMGVGDLASGFTNLLIPGMKSMATALKGTTIAQWAMNSALLASPLTWIILAIVALVAVIVLIATKTTWFQDLWSWVWGKIGDPVKKFWGWFKKIPGWTKDLFSKVAGFIMWPYKTAFNAIADAWNNTVGKLRWTVPDWVPIVGGKTVSAPRLPKFHTGGRVPGSANQEMLAVLRGGEQVVANPGRGGGMLIVGSDGSRLGDLLVEVLEKASRTRGGLDIRVRSA